MSTMKTAILVSEAYDLEIIEHKIKIDFLQNDIQNKARTNKGSLLLNCCK